MSNTQGVDSPVIVSLNCLTTSLLKRFGHENFTDFELPEHMKGKRVPDEYQRETFKTISEKCPNLSEIRNDRILKFICALSSYVCPCSPLIICLQEVDNSLYHLLYQTLNQRRFNMTQPEVYQATRKPGNSAWPEIDYGGCITLYRNGPVGSLTVLHEEAKLVEWSPFQHIIFEYTNNKTHFTQKFTVQNCHRAWKCYKPLAELCKKDTISVGDLNLTEYYCNPENFNDPDAPQKALFRYIEKKKNTFFSVVPISEKPTDDVIMSNYQTILVTTRRLVLSNLILPCKKSMVLRLSGKISLDDYLNSITDGGGSTPYYWEDGRMHVVFPDFMTDHHIVMGNIIFNPNSF